MKSWRVLVLAAAAMLAAATAARAEYEVIAQTNVEYAQHDGAKLVADLYQPKGLARAPAIIAVHGGGWQNGSRAGYRNWGPLLAKNGYVVLSIDYRLGKPGTYPASVYDVRAAIQFVRAKAESLGVDPDRIGLMGDSAGSHLVALLGLAGADPLEHASTWNDHLVDDHSALGDALDRWTEYFSELDVGWITEGAVLLRRRPGHRHPPRVDPASADELEHAGPQIERAFAAHAFLAGLESDADLVDAELTLTDNVTLETRLDPHTRERETRLLLDEGTYPDLACAPAVADALASLDGVATLREGIERLGLPRKAEAAVRAEAIDALRDLLELGFVELDD